MKIKYGAFIDAMVLMLLNKFIKNSTLRTCSFSSTFKNHDAKFAAKYNAKFAANIMQNLQQI